MEFVGQTAAGDKAGGNTLAAGLHSQACGQVGLARAALAQKDDVALLTDIFPRSQLMQQTSIQTRGGMVVKNLQRLQQRWSPVVSEVSVRRVTFGFPKPPQGGHF